MGFARQRETPGEERITCTDCDRPELEVVYAYRVGVIFLTCIARDRLTGRRCGAQVYAPLHADGQERLDKLPPLSLGPVYAEGERYTASKAAAHA